MIFILKLDQCSTKLCKVAIYQIGELVAVQDRLFLKDAHISPCFDIAAVNIPICSVTNQICTVMQETRWPDDFPVTCSLHVHQLGRSRTHKNDKTVLLLLSMDFNGVK